MAELPRMVTALKGSAMLRTAIQAFSWGFIGFTCGPLVKRAYQSIWGKGWGHGVVCAPGGGLTLGAAGRGEPSLEAASAVSAASPAFLTGQGLGSAALSPEAACGRGVSGSAGSGLGLSACPARASVAGKSNAASSSEIGR